MIQRFSNYRYGRGYTAVAFCFAVLSLSAPSRTFAAEGLRKELTSVCENVAKFLEGRNESSISIGQFTGPPNLQANAGPGIARILAEEFQARNISVKARAAVGIKGDYALVEAPDEVELRKKTLAVEIRGTLVDPFGAVLTEFSVKGLPDGQFAARSTSEQSIIDMAAPSVMMPTGGTAEDRTAKLKESILTPTCVIRGGEVTSASDCPYAMEILVKQAPRIPKLVDDLPFVNLERSEIYQVRLINNSDLDAAVRLSIDGLNSFTFSEVRHKAGPSKGEPQYSFYVLPPKSSAIIKGWHRTNETADAFLVTEYAKSAAATLHHEADVGTITASFMAAWPADQAPPKDEPPATRGAGNATALGPPREQKATPVARKVGVVRAAVSVRYSKPKN